MSPDGAPGGIGPLAPGAIKVEHLFKRYRSTLARPLLRDQLRQLGRRGKDYAWVLRDIDFDVTPGESLGLLGLNGSGKSTLLKILAGVTFPYAGRALTGGRIGALIEVRSGIHPDLTGRENAYFYGTVLGLSRRQIAQRFDEMVEFGELQDAVDRQVKFYSSGMQMRLGFAVAAFLEPDILLVDEALAVGDINFQQRCLERMRTVQDQGTTLIFVSHDLAAVEAMCSRAIWLDDGVARGDGPVREVLASYRVGLEAKAKLLSERIDDPIVVAEVQTSGPGGAEPETDRDLTVALTLRAEVEQECEISIAVSEGPATPVFVVTEKVRIPVGDSEHRCVLRHLPLPAGRYYLWLGATAVNGDRAISWRPVTGLDVIGPPKAGAPKGVMLLSPVHVTAVWESGEVPAPAPPPPHSGPTPRARIRR
jgi:ABC-type polysaccharide/polyol phosphate transport system ATPase subunit